MDTGTIELTELEKLEVTRVDAVGRPANGFPVLLMKGVAEPAAKDAGQDAPPEFDRDAALAMVKAVVGRKIDETPDIAGGTAVLAMIFDLIIAEAQEGKAGNTGEIRDIQQLACAAEMIWCWRTGEESVASGSVMPATALMQSAAWTPEQVAEFRAGFEKAFPGTGDTADDQIAKEGTTVDTETQTGDLEEVVKAAEAKAAALEKRVIDQESATKALEVRMAKVEAAPVLGGPVMSAVRPKTAPDGEDHARKAAYFDDWAERVASPEDADRYRQLAAQERAKITS